MNETTALLARVERERIARTEAESLLEEKSRELHAAVQETGRLNEQLEKTVRLQTRELLSAQRMTKLGTFVWDIKQNVISWTAAGLQVLGIDAANTTNSFEEFIEIIHPDDRHKMLRLQESLRKYAENPDDVSIDTERIFRVPIAGEKVHWIKFVCELTDLTSVSGAVQDITESVLAGEEIHEARKELEERLTDLEDTQRELRIANKKAQTASATKSRFIAMVSHEIRTPLNGLLGTLTLLADSRLIGTQKELLGVAVSSAESLRILVNDIIDFARLETGKIQLETAEFEIRELVSQLIEFWKPLASSSENGLQAKIDGKVPKVLLGDAIRIGQILNNLISNAIKFTRNGEVWIEVKPGESRQLTPKKFNLLIEIKDTGKGLTIEEQDSLFKEFSQVPIGGGEPRRVFDFSGSKSGAGLGLAICRTLVEQMGGRISVTSSPGVGSTFTVRLALEAGSDAIKKEEPIEIKPLFNLMGDKPRALVADDVPANQLVARMLLQSFGCQVDIVNDGVEAVAACKNRRYDFVLMDVSMPRLDGVAATRQIRSLEPPAEASIPIIGLTAFAFTDEIDNFIDAGMNEVISKPVRKDALYKVASSALQGSFKQMRGEAVPDDDPTLSIGVLQKLTSGLSRKQVLKVMEQISTDLDKYRKNAIADVKAGNLLSLARSCHAIKGLAASFGNQNLADLASQIEESARYGDSELAFAVTLDRLGLVTDAALVAYKKLLVNPDSFIDDC